MPLPSFTFTGSIFDVLGNVAAGELVENGFGSGGSAPATVTFTPNVPVNQFVTWNGHGDRLKPVVARINSAGEILRNGETVLLTANDPGLSVSGLQYRVDVQGMKSFSFNAPNDGDTKDFSTVVPVAYVAATALSKGDPGDSLDSIRRVGDTIVGTVAGVDIPNPVDISDFVVTPADMVSDTLIDAKGDILVGTADNTVARKAVGANGKVLAADSTQATGLAWVDGINAIFINVKDPAYGAVGDGVANDTAAILAAIAAIPAEGACVFFPAGVYLCTTVASGVILKLNDKPNVTLMGYGLQSILRFAASCTDALRIETCSGFKMRDMQVQVTSGTVTRAVHFTTSSPGSAHLGRFDNVFIDNPTSTSRNAYDVMTTSGSAVIYSAASVFAAGDVGGRVLVDYQVAPHITTISSVATLSGTLAAGINSSVTTITLNSVLTNSPPASGFTIKIGTERMYVTAGGNTTTLTVVRGRGKDLVATSHSTSDAVTTYKATLAATVPFTTPEPAAMIRIESTAAHMDYGLAIGMDHPGASNLDIAQTMLTGVTVTNAVGAGVAIGNGTSGNILDQWAYGLSVAKCGYGVLMDGGSISIDGGDCGYALVDIKRLQPVSQEVKIDGWRSEELGMFYEYTGAVTGGPGTRFSSVEAYNIYAEDGIAIRHLSAAPLLLQNVQLNASQLVNGIVYILAFGNSTNPCHVVALNVGTTTGANTAFLEYAENRLTVINEQIIFATTGEIVPNTNVPNRMEGGFSVNGVPLGAASVSAASASSLTPNVGIANMYAYTALAAGLTINAPTGTASDGQPLDFRIVDNGTTRALTWNAVFRALGVTIPTATTANKTVYVRSRYNAAATAWDVYDVKLQA